MLRRIGSLLLFAGVTVGVAVGSVIVFGLRPAGMSWWVAVGLTKLTLLGSGGLMSAGAVCLRLENRSRRRRELAGVERLR